MVTMSNDNINHWPFADPPNVAVYTTADVTESENPICNVTHEADDGSWQFHSNAPFPEDVSSIARIVSLQSIVKLDPTISSLADLPLGWRAWRETCQDVWQRAPDR